MQTRHNQTFTDVDLGKMMAAANTARADELRKMFRAARTYIANIFAAGGKTATQS